MKAIVDKETCTGCSLCESTCPDVFKMEDNIAVTTVGTVPEAAQESCQQAADDCPVEAIKIEG